MKILTPLESFEKTDEFSREYTLRGGIKIFINKPKLLDFTKSGECNITDSSGNKYNIKNNLILTVSMEA